MFHITYGLVGKLFWVSRSLLLEAKHDTLNQLTKEKNKKRQKKSSKKKLVMIFFSFFRVR